MSLDTPVTSRRSKLGVSLINIGYQNERTPELDARSFNSSIAFGSKNTLMSDDDEEKDEKSMKYKLEEFCTESSVNAITRAYKTKSKLRRYTWLTMFLFSVTLVFAQSRTLVTKYFTYPSEVKLDMIYEPELELPSVTICNLNPIRRSKLFHNEKFEMFATNSDTDEEDELYKSYKNKLNVNNYEEPDEENDDVENGSFLNDETQDGTEQTEAQDTTTTTQDLTTETVLSNDANEETVNNPGESFDEPGETNNNPVEFNDGPGEPFGYPVGPNAYPGESFDPAEPSEYPEETIDDPEETIDDPEESIDDPEESIDYPSEGTATTDAPTLSWEEEEEEEEEEDDFNKWTYLANQGSSFYSQENSRHKEATKMMQMISEADEETMGEIGHQLEDMLIECSWAGYQCSPQNFTRLQNDYYGNCFTFNAGDMGNAYNLSWTNETTEPLTVSKGGPLYGLTLELFIEQHEYVGDLSPGAGMRVVVHSVSQMPFPEDEGFDIAPGYATSVGLKKTKITRLPSPHGTCDPDLDATTLYSDKYGVEYSKEACMKSCYQKNVIDVCGCAVHEVPKPDNVPMCTSVSDSITTNTTNTTTAAPTTISSNTTTDDDNSGEDHDEMGPSPNEQCMMSVEAAYKKNELGCGEECPLRCLDYTYDMLISNAEWPSMDYSRKLTRKMMQSSSSMKGVTGNMKANLVKLEVYFQEMSVEHIEQQKSYEIENLLSDLGGQLGLWLGLSAITACEFIEFVIDVIKLIITKCSSKRNERSTTPIEPFKS
ncbi:unnamed protein product [Owenia fusiformis]|uniref:Uncharacterized protein n=1 Tax=Owenia fusiformis TaxID=6347 RepID=A0A8J1TW69_OWEFU|nr:unnamed protein product [Owenia fusiformis]